MENMFELLNVRPEVGANVRYVCYHYFFYGNGCKCNGLDINKDSSMRHVHALHDEIFRAEWSVF